MRRVIEWPRGDQLETAWEIPLVEVHTALPSTQDRAMELARGGADPWSAVIAEAQVRGRGRRGDPWESTRGLGLWMSLVLPPTQTEGATLPIPLRLGLGVAEAIEGVLGPAESRVGVKWPNDVWIRGRKVAGVLVERSGDHIVGGIGVNLLHESQDFGREVARVATSLARSGWTGDAVSFGRSMIARMRDAWAAPSEAVVQGLNQRDVLMGRRVVLDDGRRGNAGGIEASGALRVCGDEEEWRVYAGSIRLESADEDLNAEGS